MADLKQEYAINATVQTITIDFDSTIINDGTVDIFKRKRDPTITPAGNAATLIATPFFCERLNSMDNIYFADTETLQVVCATGESATLRVISGKLEQTGDIVLDAIAKGGLAGSTNLISSEKINATIRVDGTSVNGVALDSLSVPYIRATVTARKKVTDADKASIANVGTVWIGRSASDISGATPLEPGQSMSLFDNGNLQEYFLIVEEANDGVSIMASV